MFPIECPGCAAAFTVPEAKAGQTVRCPTCGTQVAVSAADADLPFVAADSTPEPAGQESVEVRPCPGCQARIAVARGDLGTTVECPYCVTRFLAEAATETPPVPTAPRREPDRRSRRRDETDDELDDDDERPRRGRSRRSASTGNVSTLGVLLIVGGVYSLLQAAGLVLGTFAVCCLWPGTYLAIVWGILAIVRGSSMTSGRDSNGSPPLVLHILQILLIINFDVINMILGIVGLVLSNNAQTQDYYAGNTGRSDD